jgi:FixJ family two-component response regulator
MLRTEPLVIVVDDDPAVRRSVARTLATNGYQVRTFESGRDYLNARPGIEPDCLLADIRMPELDGVALHEAARRAGLEVPTVFMTASADVPTIVSAMKSGAFDLLPKPFSTKTLLSTIDGAVQRARSSRDVRAHLLALWTRARALTPREAEVAALVASGRLNKQIAALIGTGEKTVKVHRARAMQKLRVSSVAQLVRTLDELLAARRERVVMADGAYTAPDSVRVMERAMARVSGPTMIADSSRPTESPAPDATKGQYLAMPPDG